MSYDLWETSVAKRERERERDREREKSLRGRFLFYIPNFWRICRIKNSIKIAHLLEKAPLSAVFSVNR